MSKADRKRKQSVDFHLSTPHYKNIHLMIYFVSIFGIFLIYLFTSAIMDNIDLRNVIVVVASVCVGIFLVFKRDILVKETSDWLIESKRRRMKTDNKEGLQTALRRITPKPKNKNLKLDIKGKVPLKEKIKKFFEKKDKNKKGPDYIEIED